MSAESTTTPIPPFAITLWCDLRSIYVTLPSHNGPCVVTYPRDAHGLSDILRLMKSRHAEESGPIVYTPPPLPVKSTVDIAPASREVVRSLLRRKGVLGGPR